MRRIVPCLVLAYSFLVFAGCATVENTLIGLPYEVQPIGGEDGVLSGSVMVNNWIHHPYKYVQLGFNAGIIVKARETRTFLRVLYLGPDWVFIQPGESLILQIGRERFTATRDSSVVRESVLDAGLLTIREVATYYVDPGLIRRIAEANRVTIEVVGGNYTLEGDLSDGHFRRFREFVTEKFESPPP